MNGWLPDRVLCSTAARTVATARLFLAAAGIDPPVELRKEIYEARPSVLLALIQAQPEGGRLMLVGHNPGFHELALQLAGKGADPRLDEKFPTGALAAIEFDAPSFAEVRPGEGRLAAFALPRELE